MAGHGNLETVPFGVDLARALPVPAGVLPEVHIEGLPSEAETPFGADMLNPAGEQGSKGVLACVYGINTGVDENLGTSVDDRRVTESETLPFGREDIAQLN